MASPQTENGYTVIAHELLEELAKAKLNGSQYSIILAVIRATYGFKKKSYQLSLTFISGATDISQRQVRRELTELIDRNIIIVLKEATFNEPRELGINKDYESWLERPQGAKKTSLDRKDTLEGTKKTSRTGDGLDPQKNYTLKTISKTIYSEHFESLWLLYPNKKGKHAVAKSQAKLKQLYKVTVEEMSEAIDRYKKELDREKQTGFNRKFKDGSTWFNGAYVDYLGTNYAGSIGQAELSREDELKAMQDKYKRMEDKQ